MQRLNLLLCIVALVSPLLANDVEQRLVRIETVGGTDTVGTGSAVTITSDAAATGVLLDSTQRDGKTWCEVVTSFYQFRNRPSAIIVRLSDGSSHSARLVATDHTRMLSLLTWESPRESRVVQPPLRESRVQIGDAVSAIGLLPDAVAKTSGIVSGTRRFWGRAIQTDAAVGPTNYGGLLIHRDGGVIGVLVPLTLTDAKLFEGADFYDSGVGFAIPWSDAVLRVVPRLREGHDLHETATGIRFAPSSVWIGGAALVDSVEPKSRGEAAGIVAGDTIVAIDGNAVTSSRQATFLFAERYAEDAISVTIRRGTNEVTLVLEPSRDKP
ncbi:MAG: S1C family serine protease [Thermoguttaceae bacterium]